MNTPYLSAKPTHRSLFSSPLRRAILKPTNDMYIGHDPCLPSQLFNFFSNFDAELFKDSTIGNSSPIFASSLRGRKWGKAQQWALLYRRGKRDGRGCQSCSNEWVGGASLSNPLFSLDFHVFSLDLSVYLAWLESDRVSLEILEWLSLIRVCILGFSSGPYAFSLL
jgi:hypothetical protein